MIAIILERKQSDNKEQASLELHYEFNHEDIMKAIGGYFGS